MEIVSAPPEHRKQYAQASLHLADEAAPVEAPASPDEAAPAASAEAQGEPA
jgi:hypothetical protein